MVSALRYVLHLMLVRASLMPICFYSPHLPREHGILFLKTTSTSMSVRTHASRRTLCSSLVSPFTHKQAQSGQGGHGKKSNRFMSVLLSEPCRGCWNASRLWMVPSLPGRKSSFWRTIQIANVVLLHLPRCSGLNKGRRSRPSKTAPKLASTNAG